MGTPKSNRKRHDCMAHRDERYGHWLDKLIEGTARPLDVTRRWKKVKQVRGK